MIGCSLYVIPERQNWVSPLSGVAHEGRVWFLQVSTSMPMISRNFVVLWPRESVNFRIIHRYFLGDVIVYSRQHRLWVVIFICRCYQSISWYTSFCEYEVLWLAIDHCICMCSGAVMQDFVDMWIFCRVLIIDICAMCIDRIFVWTVRVIPLGYF